MEKRRATFNASQATELIKDAASLGVDISDVESTPQGINDLYNRLNNEKYYQQLETSHYPQFNQLFAEVAKIAVSEKIRLDAQMAGELYKVDHYSKISRDNQHLRHELIFKLLLIGKPDQQQEFLKSQDDADIVALHNSLLLNRVSRKQLYEKFENYNDVVNNMQERLKIAEENIKEINKATTNAEIRGFSNLSSSVENDEQTNFVLKLQDANQAEQEELLKRQAEFGLDNMNQLLNKLHVSRKVTSENINDAFKTELERKREEERYDKLSKPIAFLTEKIKQIHIEMIQKRIHDRLNEPDLKKKKPDFYLEKKKPSFFALGAKKGINKVRAMENLIAALEGKTQTFFSEENKQQRDLLLEKGSNTEKIARPAMKFLEEQEKQNQLQPKDFKKPGQQRPG